jgi:hypothetical protein
MTAVKKNNNNEDISEAQKRYSRFVEETRLWSDYLKHIATLDSGLIIIMATFLGRFIQPKNNGLVAVSVTNLALSILFVILTQTILAVAMSVATNDVNKIPLRLGKLIYLIPGLLAFLGLAGGLIYLGLFIIANIPN